MIKRYNQIFPRANREYACPSRMKVSKRKGRFWKNVREIHCSVDSAFLEMRSLFAYMSEIIHFLHFFNNSALLLIVTSFIFDRTIKGISTKQFQNFMNYFEKKLRHKTTFSCERARKRPNFYAIWSRACSSDATNFNASNPQIARKSLPSRGSVSRHAGVRER